MSRRPRSARLLVAIALLATAPAGLAVEPERPAAAEPVPLPPGLSEGWYASIETSLGTIVARLLPDQAPQSVAWFAGLANGEIAWTDVSTGEERMGPYYDGLVVTRAVASNRFEAGDRTDSGRNAPRIFVTPEGAGPVNFSRPGRLGRTRSSLNQINAVRFFVTAGTLPYLNGLQPCFGEVVSGQGVVTRISEVRTGRGGAPLEPVSIRRIRVVKVGDPAPLPEPIPYQPKGVAFGPRTVGTPPRP